MTLWTVAHQAPLSVGTLQARILEWVAILFSRDLPHPGIELTFLMSPALAGRFFATSTTSEAQTCHMHYFIYSSQNIYNKETVLNPYSTDEESEFL